MNYEKMYQDAEKNKTAEEIVPTFVKFEKVDQYIVGAYIEEIEITSQNTGQTYKQYIFDTDTGRVKFHLGSNADREIGSQFVKGAIYFVQSKGKEDIGHGQSVNKWVVKLVKASDHDFVPPAIEE